MSWPVLDSSIGSKIREAGSRMGGYYDMEVALVEDKFKP